MPLRLNLGFKLALGRVDEAIELLPSLRKTAMAFVSIVASYLW